MSGSDVTEQLRKFEAELASLRAQCNELQAKDAIMDVLSNYCRGLDRRDPQLVASCFHPDAELDFGVYKGNGEGWAQVATAALDQFFEGNSFYFMGQSLLRIEGDVAYCESYHWAPKTVRQKGEDGHSELWMDGGRYLDRLERRDGEWRITKRVYVSDWEGYFPKSLNGLAPTLLIQLAEKVVVGRRDRQDPSYAFGLA